MPARRMTPGRPTGARIRAIRQSSQEIINRAVINRLTTTGSPPATEVCNKKKPPPAANSTLSHKAMSSDK